MALVDASLGARELLAMVHIADATGDDLSRVGSFAEWPQRRKVIEDMVRKMLGKMPKQRVDLQLKTIDEDDYPGYTRRRINYFVDEWERVSAWIFVPEEREDMPALLCCHDAVAQGKSEPAGIDGDSKLALARHYAQLGYVTLAPDTITAGERTVPGKDAYDTSAFYKDNPKASALGRMLVDHQQALDALIEMKHVDDERIGVIGHGLGGTNALLIAAMDDRVRTCVASCGFTRFSEDPAPERWTSGNGFRLLPQLQEAIDQKTFPFDWEHILAMAAPTPMLLITALNDDHLPNTSSCETALQKARAVYRALGAQEALSNVTHKKGRCLSSDGLAQSDAWLERWL